MSISEDGNDNNNNNNNNNDNNNNSNENKDNDNNNNNDNNDSNNNHYQKRQFVQNDTSFSLPQDRDKYFSPVGLMPIKMESLKSCDFFSSVQSSLLVNNFNIFNIFIVGVLYLHFKTI